MGAAGILFGTPKRKVFVSFQHRGDRAYYDLFTQIFHDYYQVVYDNSLERQIDSDNVDYVMRAIRENFITGSSCTIVLVGQNTWGRKFVDWEIDATLQKWHGLVGIQLPTLVPNVSGKVVVPNRLYENIASGYAVWIAWNYIASNPTHLAKLIEQANGNSKDLIRNSAERRLRNA